MNVCRVAAVIRIVNDVICRTASYLLWPELQKPSLFSKETADEACAPNQQTVAAVKAGEAKACALGSKSEGATGSWCTHKYVRMWVCVGCRLLCVRI